VEEAAALIHERGVAGTTLEDVKVAAEVSGSQLYHYFPDKNELVQAVIEYVFRSHGAMRNGYPSIVGSGPNACVLHYTRNNRKMQPEDLLLVDAGAEFEFYSGDITRTYPVSGKFSWEQRALYDIVLNFAASAVHDAHTLLFHRHLHVGMREHERMAERDQVAGAFGGGDARDARDLQRVALGIRG
jgi:AcrR family transcriptional regulator